MYLAKFDSEGNRITTVVEGVHFSTETEKQKYIADGFVEISEQDQKLYQTNEYVRGEDGKPQKKPAYVPSEEEIKQQQLAKLELDYQTAVAELQKSLAVAQLRNDTALISELRNDFAELQVSYQAEKEAIENADSTETL